MHADHHVVRAGIHLEVQPVDTRDRNQPIVELGQGPLARIAVRGNAGQGPPGDQGHGADYADLFAGIELAPIVGYPFRGLAPQVGDSLIDCGDRENGVSQVAQLRGTGLVGSFAAGR